MKNKLNNITAQQMPDERQASSSYYQCAIAMTFGVILDVVMIFYHFITRTTDKALPYVAQLVIMGIGVLIASASDKNKDITPPKGFAGRRLNTEKSCGAFLKRVASYAVSGAVFASAVTVFDIYTEKNISGSAMTDAAMMFVIFTLIETAAGEWSVHRYRKALKKQEEEENDLDD